MALMVLISNFSLAQQADEAIIRQLENAEREAILKGDSTVLLQLMSPQIVVQNPENAIVGFTKIMDRVKAGKINYSSFERNIETGGSRPRSRAVAPHVDPRRPDARP